MLTILIPYYKISFFRETLESLENQTCKDFKLFIGNDNSPDNPEALIEDVLVNTPFVYKKYDENLGGNNLVKQWNRVYQDAKVSEWFMILGDDDVLLPDFVEVFYKNLSEIQNNHCNAVKYRAKLIDENGDEKSDFSKFPTLLDPKDYFSTKILYGSRSSLSEHVFRKNIFEKYGFREFPLAWESDNAALLETSENQPIFFIDESGVLVRVSDENISGRKDNMKEKSTASIMFQKHIINHLGNRISSEALNYLIDLQIYYKYHEGIGLDINLFKHYWVMGKYKKILALPKTYFTLWKHNHFSKI